MIPEGVFTLGVNPNNKIIHFMSDTTLSLNAQPAQKIHLKSFFIDKFEVTYEAFHGFKPKFRYETVNPNEPIRGVSWYEADAYCLFQDKRQKLNGKKLLEDLTKGCLCGENNSGKKMQILGNRFVRLAVYPMILASTE